MQDKELRYTWVYNPTPDLSPDMLIGKRDADLLDPESAARLDEIKGRVLRSGQGMREQVWLVTAGGQRRCYDLTVEPLRSGDGNITGITCAALDITERQMTKGE
jgi:two-component system cell cycle sensor histidine kinase/response regulator CckA